MHRVVENNGGNKTREKEAGWRNVNAAEVKLVGEPWNRYFSRLTGHPHSAYSTYTYVHLEHSVSTNRISQTHPCEHFSSKIGHFFQIDDTIDQRLSFKYRQQETFGRMYLIFRVIIFIR